MHFLNRIRTKPETNAQSLRPRKEYYTLTTNAIGCNYIEGFIYMYLCESDFYSGIQVLKIFKVTKLKYENKIDLLSLDLFVL